MELIVPVQGSSCIQKGRPCHQPEQKICETVARAERPERERETN